MMVLLQFSRRKICPDVVLCYGYMAAGTWKTYFWLFGVLLHYRHYRVNMIIQFGAICLSFFLLQIQLNNMCLSRENLVFCGIFNEKKRGKLQLIHSLQSSKDGVWQHQGWFSPRHSYMFPKAAHFFAPFLLFFFVASKLAQKVLQQCYQFIFRISLNCINLELRWT